MCIPYPSSVSLACPMLIIHEVHIFCLKKTEDRRQEWAINLALHVFEGPTPLGTVGIKRRRWLSISINSVGLQLSRCPTCNCGSAPYRMTCTKTLTDAEFLCVCVLWGQGVRHSKWIHTAKYLHPLVRDWTHTDIHPLTLGFTYRHRHPCVFG